MLVNAGPTVRIRRERLSATFGQVGMFVFNLGDWKHFTTDSAARSSRHRSVCGRIPRSGRRTAPQILCKPRAMRLPWIPRD